MSSPTLADDSEISENFDLELDDGFLQSELMYDVEERIKSFGGVGKWFESGPAVKKNMAKLGFYVPDEDHRKRKAVKCIYCRHDFLDWTRNHDPKCRHLEESPDCLFIQINKEEMKMTIRELLELQKFATLRKWKEEAEIEKSQLVAKIEETRKALLVETTASLDKLKNTNDTLINSGNEDN